MTRPKKYRTKEPDQTGMKGREPNVVRSFWKDHTVEQIMTLEPEDRDKLIDESLERFIKRQISNAPRWNFPDIRLTP